MFQIASYIDGGWIQEFKPSAYRFPDSEKALADAIGAVGPSLGPKLLSMSEFLMSSLNETYQSRFDFDFLLSYSFLSSPYGRQIVVKNSGICLAMTCIFSSIFSLVCSWAFYRNYEIIAINNGC